MMTSLDKSLSDNFDAAETLRKMDFFRSLDDEDLGKVSGMVRWKQFKKGSEVIAYQGCSDDVYLIASGSVRVTIYSYTGKEISYQELGPGEIFGELSAIDGLPRTANVITLEATRLGTISRNNYWELITRHPGVAAVAIRRLASVVRFLIDRVYQYGALDVKDRVRLEVLRLARENMSSDDTATISNFPTHREIANRVNTHREAVTRELNELSRMGLIKQNRRELKVTRVSELADLMPGYS